MASNWQAVEQIIRRLVPVADHGHKSIWRPLRERLDCQGGKQPFTTYEIQRAVSQSKRWAAEKGRPWTPSTAANFLLAAREQQGLIGGFM